MTTNRAFCRSLGHLPRRLLQPPQAVPGATFEACLRCGVVLCRRDDGTEKESRTLVYPDGKVCDWRAVPAEYQHVDLGELSA